MVELDSLKKNIDKLLKKQLISGKIFLDKLGFIDENSRKTVAYTDPNYVPFYYYLGKFIKPISFLSLNFSLGLLESCFFKSCKSVEYFYGFHQKNKDYYSIRIGNKNLGFKKNKKIYIGDFRDDNFNKDVENSWDLVLINEELSYDRYLEYLEFIWPYLNENGLIICENICYDSAGKNAFISFSESINRKPVIFHTRYGTGILQK